MDPVVLGISATSVLLQTNPRTTVQGNCVTKALTVLRARQYPHPVLRELLEQA